MDSFSVNKSYVINFTIKTFLVADNLYLINHVNIYLSLRITSIWGGNQTEAISLFLVVFE